MFPNHTVSCPLCGSQSLERTETIQVNDLQRLYDRMLGHSIAKEFDGHILITMYCCRGCDLKFFNPAVTGSEDFYEKMQKFDWYYLESKEEYDTAAEFIRNSDNVLEVGCGNGAFFRKIRPKSYVGLELSQKAVQVAASCGAQILNEFVEDHAVKHKGLYDVVCAFQVLEHVSDVKGFISASLDCLKPDGVFIVSVPSADSFVPLAPNNLLNLPPHHVTWWSDESLKSMCSIFGLELIALEHESISDIHRPWYVSIAIERSINKFLGRQIKVVDTRIFNRIIHVISFLFGNICSHVMKKELMGIRGHSVTVVCRKSGRGPFNETIDS